MSLKSSVTTITKRDITLSSIPKGQKLVSVLAISTPVIGTREKSVKAVETAGTGKDSKENRGKYPENLTQVPCI